ncbi:MAG TPA: hypothetical protein VD908_05525 [Cytophagales bacterium]|nr:hypothetical protein [Cytophagales bacterium]
MQSLRILAIVAAALLVFSSCEEDEKPQSKTSILTSKNWKMTAQTVNPGFPIGNGAVITDFYEQFYEDCDKDNTRNLMRTAPIPKMKVLQNVTAKILRLFLAPGPSIQMKLLYQ